MRPIEFTLQLFGRYPGDEAKSEADRHRSERVLLWLLQALTEANKIWLRTHPNTPPIYSGVTAGRPRLRYRREVDNEVWADIPTLLQIGYGDCEDLGCARAAELSVKGIRARPYISWRLMPQGGYLYHCRTWRATVDREMPPMLQSPSGRPVVIREPVTGDGFVEDPSLVLGMGWMPEAPANHRELAIAAGRGGFLRRGD